MRASLYPSLRCVLGKLRWLWATAKELEPIHLDRGKLGCGTGLEARTVGIATTVDDPRLLPSSAASG